ncbi:uracil-xanthine permease family protein [Coraliomargarita sp. SDUM461004]|uniref:Uracil-xanthine permease family protein n=1 Tax=Thalassobacterium sedimentorum TaxID=3041258 RepID=A0ABU1AM11_9BACT|nr:uracil-xanthine permease family protein [Coraliomargarita sp. SDUM461004]MDQ8195834.1 uracil-xanthine permease family protein [Coraliomargarita sp. SDUM461004]
MAATDYHFRLRDSIIGLQFLFVAFGALVLVPILTGLDSNVALFTAGIGTLVFQCINRQNVPPIFLASSFAFIAPIIHGVQTWGLPATLSGLVAAGVFYILLSFVVRLRRADWLHYILPPVVVGPVIITIGLILAPVAVNMALGKTGDGSITLVPLPQAMAISMCSLLVTIWVILKGRGMFKLLPVLCGIFAGYTLSSILDVVDFSACLQAPWLAVPAFTAPQFNLEAILYMLPIAIAPAVEHLGDMLAISSATKENYLKKPGLKNTLLGDGVATSLAAALGGPPNTTYSEVTGAVKITQSFNPAIMTWAAIFAIILAFVGKLGGLLATIPVPVIGGVLILLFGIIASIGIQTIADHQVDYNNPRNLIISSVILVCAIGGMTLDFGFVSLGGIGLGAVVGIALNLLLPRT